METKAFYTVINTDNMEKTVTFYNEVLGFHQAHRIELPTGGSIIVLENDRGARIDVMNVPGDRGLHGFRTNVDDLDAAVAEIRAKGYEVSDPMQISTGKAALLRDPNGILIDITKHEKK